MWGQRTRAVLVWTALSLALGCASTPPTPPSRETVPRWEDVFDGVPDIYAVLRPQAFKRDRVYGALFTTLMRVAQARGFVRGATMVEAFEGSDEVIVGVGKGLDAAIVLRGVPGNLDPQRLVDPQGNALFRPVDERTKIVEYEYSDAHGPEGGSLFVLPDRTWVGTIGDARARARSVFATPRKRATLGLDGDALVVVRVSGSAAQAFGVEPFGELVSSATSVTLKLEPGKGGCVAALSYRDTETTAVAVASAKLWLAELAREQRLRWLGGAEVAYEGTTVLVRLAIPPRLLEELPKASASEMGL